MVTAWQGLSDMLPTTRGQPSASAHSKDQLSIFLLCPSPPHPYPHTSVPPVFTHRPLHCPTHPSHTPTPRHTHSRDHHHSLAPNDVAGTRCQRLYPGYFGKNWRCFVHLYVQSIITPGRLTQLQGKLLMDSISEWCFFGVVAQHVSKAQHQRVSLVFIYMCIHSKVFTECKNDWNFK